MILLFVLCDLWFLSFDLFKLCSVAICDLLFVLWFVICDFYK